MKRTLFLFFIFLFIFSSNIFAFDNEFYSFDLPEEYIPYGSNYTLTLQRESDNSKILIVTNYDSKGKAAISSYDISKIKNDFVDQTHKLLQSKLNAKVTLKEYYVTTLNKYESIYSKYFIEKDNIYIDTYTLWSNNYIYNIIFLNTEEAYFDSEEYVTIKNTFTLKDDYVPFDKTPLIILSIVCGLILFFFIFFIAKYTIRFSREKKKM